MKCIICGRNYGSDSNTAGDCPACLAIIIAHAVPDDEACERCDEPLVDRTGCKPRLCVDCTADDFDGSTCENCGSDNATAEDDGLCPECRDDGTGDGEFKGGIVAEPGPEDEDLVTKDRITFYRAYMGKVAFVVAPGWNWQDAAKEYMDEDNYWPDVWLEEERGGYTNITTEGP